MKRKIVFIIGSISQPRVIKRINSFINSGYEVEIYGFDRGKYNVNAEIKGAKINIVGKQEDGKNYISKIKQSYSLHKKLNEKYKSEDTIFYFFSFMTAFFSLFFSYKYIYEISDILYGYRKFKPVEWLFKIIDKKMIKKSILTIMTSEGFKDYFFGDKIINNIVLQPNKLSPYFLDVNRNNIDFSYNKDNISFSFIGAFRYPNTIFRFAHVIGKHFPQHKFKFYGDSSLTDQVKDIAKLYANVEYYGEYKNPDDLLAIYNEVDFIVACYDVDGLNERIAEPNKMYEAIFFKKPILVSSNTFLAKQVEKYKSGYAINASKDDNIINFINSLTDNGIKEIKDNIEKVNAMDLIDDNAKQIINKLQSNII